MIDGQAVRRGPKKRYSWDQVPRRSKHSLPTGHTRRVFIVIIMHDKQTLMTIRGTPSELKDSVSPINLRSDALYFAKYMHLYFTQYNKAAP